MYQVSHNNNYKLITTNRWMSFFNNPTGINGLPSSTTNFHQQKLDRGINHSNNNRDRSTPPWKSPSKVPMKNGTKNIKYWSNDTYQSSLQKDDGDMFLSKYFKRMDQNPNSPQNRKYDMEGDRYPWKKNKIISNRYRIEGIVGRGTFGCVLCCIHLQSGERVAVKVIRSVERYLKAARAETEILGHITRRNFPNCLKLLEEFNFQDPDTGKNYYAIVTPLLGMSVYDIIELNKYKGYYLEDIQNVCSNILMALRSWANDPAHYVHTDLKPENIVFNDPTMIETYVPRKFIASDGSEDYTMMRPLHHHVTIIDFGNTVESKQYQDYTGDIINTKQYRSPEVIMGQPWSAASDIWSLGCILYEMYTGTYLFNPDLNGNSNENVLQLFMIDRLVGPISQDMLKRYHHKFQHNDQYRRGLTRKMVRRVVFDERALPNRMFNGRDKNKDNEYSYTTFKLKHNNPIPVNKNEIQFNGPREFYELDINQLTRREREYLDSKCKGGLKKLISPIHSEFVNFLKCILRTDPGNRPTADELLHHTFLRSRIDERSYHDVKHLYGC